MDCVARFNKTVLCKGAHIKEAGLCEKQMVLFEKNSEGVTRLGESRNLSDLSAVVDSETALDAFTAGRPLSEAVILTEVPLQAFRISIMEAKSNLQTAWDTIYAVYNPSPSDADVLKDIQEIVRDLRIIVRQRLFEIEELEDL